MGLASGWFRESIKNGLYGSLWCLSFMDWIICAYGEGVKKFTYVRYLFRLPKSEINVTLQYYSLK